MNSNLLKKIASGLLLLALFLSCLIFAQEEKVQTNQKPNLSIQGYTKRLDQNGRYVLQRIKGPIVLDGFSFEPAWEGIDPLPPVMQEPYFGREPSERTEFLVAYDDDYLYVAGRLYDREPFEVRGFSKKRDSINRSSDFFGINIDSFNDKENVLGFFTSPSGLRTDLLIYNDGQGDRPINNSWNTFWDAATAQNQEGWFAEIRVPFSSLRFQDTDGQAVMGFILWRWIARKNESVLFPAIPPNWGAWSRHKASKAQEVVFEGVQSRKPIYLTPYALTGMGNSFELNKLATGYERVDNFVKEAGLDVKYGLTSNLTLDLTLNTDFAQVEADDQQINLTRFSLFFPEKRLFFQERSSIFDFNFGGQNRLFYSRRIGIYEGKSVRIYGGARLVGRIGSWDVGLLDMQAAPVENLLSENFSVLRLRRQVINPYSYVGTMLTNRIGTDGKFNVAYGLDGIFRLFGDDYLAFNWAQTFENNKENNPASLAPARVYINWEKRTIKGLGYNLSYSRSGADYNPGMGFEERYNFTRFGDRVFYGWMPDEKSVLLNHQVYVDGFIYLKNTDRSIESLEIGPGWEFTSKSAYTSTIGLKILYENVPQSFSLSKDVEVPAGQYTFHCLNTTFSTPRGGAFATSATLNAGTFYDGWKLTFSMTPQWSASPSLELSGTYQFNRILFIGRNQELNSHILRLSILAMMSTKLSASAFLQYNSAVSVIVANFRLRYNPREGTDFYLVYNEGLNTDRYRAFPTLPFSTGRNILLKYSYTFNF